MQPNQTLIFIGRSGAGKGTQVRLITEKMKAATGKEVLYIESGRGFRDFITNDSCSAARSREIVTEGGLQPSFLSIWVWANMLVQHVTCDEHIIFDGTPRRISEAKILESALKFYGHEKPHVIFVDVSRESAATRLKSRGRADDTTESIMARMDWFENDTTEAVKYLESNPYYDFHHINGDQTIELVHAEICSALRF
jgi:adenylate kinase